MKRALSAVAVACLAGALAALWPRGEAVVEAQEARPSGADVLAAVDRNMAFDALVADVEMTVRKSGGSKTYMMEGWARGDAVAWEFLAPPRDEGTKILKKGGEMWIYMPGVEKVLKLSGHMPRQGLMGGDHSYGDFLDGSPLTGRYDADVTGEGRIGTRECWKVEMDALDPDDAYPRRLSWVDKEDLVMVREDLYGLDDRHLKRWSFSDVQEIEGRKYPMRAVVEDKLWENSSTTLVYTALRFSGPGDEAVFTQAWVEGR